MRAGKTGVDPAAEAARRSEEEEEAAEAQRQLEAAWSPQQRIAETLVRGMRTAWGPAMQTLERAGRAFDGLEALLGGTAFDLQVLRLLPCPSSPNSRSLAPGARMHLVCLPMATSSSWHGASSTIPCMHLPAESLAGLACMSQ